MMPSMFCLDHRLAELRPTDGELRRARLLREAALPTVRPARSIGAAFLSLFGRAAAGRPVGLTSH